MEKMPKEYICIKKVLEGAVSSAVCEFNGGKAAVSNVYKRLGLVCSIYKVNGHRKKDYYLMKAMGRGQLKTPKKKKKIQQHKKRFCR